MKRNILLVIIDCLRFDKVNEDLMPFTRRWGMENVWFSNHRVVSHCTDPSITMMLSGVHPDVIGLYSMMYEHRDYTIPNDIKMISEVARGYGYFTGLVSNLARWYRRGQNVYLDCRGWAGSKIFDESVRLVKSFNLPWFLIVHDDSCHREYERGSYDNACRAVDTYIKKLLDSVDQENTDIIITADHGEGLGQESVTGRKIIQHGFGLDPFLTHVPLLVKRGAGDMFPKKCVIDQVTDNMYIYQALRYRICGANAIPAFGRPVFQAGDTPPNIRHRGIVLPDQKQFIIESQGGKVNGRYYIGQFTEGEKRSAEEMLAGHCSRHGIDYWAESMEPEAESRLRGLGYFG